MGAMLEAVRRKAAAGVDRSDVKINPLPLGAPWGATRVLPETGKIKSDVFGLTLARPCALMIDCGELTYNSELQIALQSLEGPWDSSVLPRMQTVAATIEGTPPTGTITRTGNAACPDTTPDTDASDRFRD